MKTRLFLFMPVILVAIFVSTSAIASASAEQCLNTFYSMISSELDRAHIKLGRPQTNFENLVTVKDTGMASLEAKVKNWPKDATFSISVLNDYISFAVFCDGKQKQGEWRPDHKF